MKSIARQLSKITTQVEQLHCVSKEKAVDSWADHNRIVYVFADNSTISIDKHEHVTVDNQSY